MRNLSVKLDASSKGTIAAHRIGHKDDPRRDKQSVLPKREEAFGAAVLMRLKKGGRSAPKNRLPIGSQGIK